MKAYVGGVFFWALIAGLCGYGAFLAHNKGESRYHVEIRDNWGNTYRD